MSLRTLEQNSTFHKLVTQHKLDADEKMAIVMEVSGGRTKSSADLSRIEMAKAIKILQGKSEESRKKRMAKAINLAKDLGMVKDKDFTGLNSFGKRMFGKDKFYELTDKEISSAIIGLENMKKEKDLKT
ncbi:phage protein GemA/Gp16 family protein [Flectobacillus roseus]